MEHESSPRIDYNSHDWHRIVEHLQGEREDSIRFLLNKDTDLINTAFHRGRIAQIDAVLDWHPHTSRISR